MRAWPSPHLPLVPGDPVPLRLHDVARQRVEPVEYDGRATLYVCGVTPYDTTHMGHAATYVTFDLVGRALRDGGREVTYVQNVTDVDDPLLERAVETGQDWTELAERETELFRKDMEALRVLPPAAYVGAVESIPLVIELIQRLEAAGAIYRVETDLYFSVSADTDFGAESGYDRDTMLRFFGERGGDPDRADKLDPLDCVVWRGEREGDRLLAVGALWTIVKATAVGSLFLWFRPPLRLSAPGAMTSTSRSRSMLLLST